jgi:uncharacterized membrane protein YccC
MTPNNIDQQIQEIKNQANRFLEKQVRNLMLTLFFGTIALFICSYFLPDNLQINMGMAFFGGLILGLVFGMAFSFIYWLKND